MSAEGRSRGCQYKERCKTRRCIFKLAASADLQAEFPSLVLLLRAVSQVPGNTYELHSEESLLKSFSEQQEKKNKQTKRLDTAAANWAILSTATEKFNVAKGIQIVYRSVPAFIRLVGRVNQAAMCPGYQKLVVD